jgi:hypothetical protein
MCPIALEGEDGEARMDKDSGWATNHHEQAAAEHREAEQTTTRLQLGARQKQVLTGKLISRFAIASNTIDPTRRSSKPPELDNTTCLSD